MKAAVMGYGTIGSGVVEVLDINGSREIRSRIRSYTTIRRLKKILR